MKSYTRFSEIISQKGITPYRVATDTGISPMTLSDWKNDNVMFRNLQMNKEAGDEK